MKISIVKKSALNLFAFIRRITVFLLSLSLLATGCAHQSLPQADFPASKPAIAKKTLKTPNSIQRRPSKIPGYPAPYKVLGRWYQPLPSAEGFQQEGIASWYGPAFHGRATSSGERYNMYEVTAAHKTLPLNTWVRVYNLENRRYLDIRINDRGPFVPGRIIDLSYGAAVRLGIAENGLAPVRVVALGVPAEKTGRSGTPKAFVPVDYSHGNFTFQVAAFKSRENAERLMRELAESYESARIKSDMAHTGDRFHRVLVGRCRNLNEAEQYEAFLRQRGFSDPILVAE